MLRGLLREHKSEYQSVNDNGHGHKKRKVDFTAPSSINHDRNFVGDERDDTGTIQRKDDEIRMPSLGEAVSVSEEVSDRQMVDSTIKDHDDLDVIPPSILLAMMKNHTVI